MTVPLDIRARAKELVHLLEYHGWRYHVKDSPEIDDPAYDALFRELQTLENKYPELRRPDSPTLRVGGMIMQGLPSMRHTLPMYSLDNAFGQGEWDDFVQRLLRLLPEYSANDLSFWMEPKMDGLAMELIYKKGVLETALTRGDGETGEMVTENMRTVRNIPLRLRGTDIPSVLEVRGEVLMAKKDFPLLNERQIERGQKPFANPRNAAAGSVRQLDSSVAASRPLRFIAYGTGVVQWAEGINVHTVWTSQQSVMLGLQSFGFSIAPQAILCEGSESAGQWLEDLAKKRDVFPFELDGGVAKLNNLQLQEKVGYTARAPRWAIAFKFAAMQAQTRLLNIYVQVGRTGVLTPVAVLEPVNIGGVTVSRASLHNEDEIENNDIRIGDTVVIQRAGDVIPEIVKPVLEKRTGAELKFIFPTLCPECGNHAHRESGEAAWRCVNRLCPAIHRESIKHFVSKAGLDIKGIGSKWVEQFVELKLVTSPADLFCLTMADLLPLDRMGETLAAKFIDAFAHAKKHSTLPRLLCALGIRHVGEQTAKSLAKNFKSIDALMDASEEALCKVPDVGPEVAASIQNFFAEDGNKKLLEELRALGLWPVVPSIRHNTMVNGTSDAKGVTTQQLGFFVDGSIVDHLKSGGIGDEGALSGKTIVFTGSLSMPRSQAEKLAEDAGANVLGSVSRKLDYLVVGDAPGSKLAKAEQLGVVILDESAFHALLEK